MTEFCGAEQDGRATVALNAALSTNPTPPGIIASPMTDDSFDKATIERIVPAKRAGTPDDVAALAGFLASLAAGYITGQIISVNSGLY